MAHASAPDNPYSSILRARQPARRARRHVLQGPYCDPPHLLRVEVAQVGQGGDVKYDWTLLAAIDRSWVQLFWAMEKLFVGGEGGMT